ncbi:nodulation protein NodH [Actibacterium sp.]|uniref:nodulation protein NodH n=1 Tax=Actibacterium sp. TaxID=1872125 RepID=UPI00356319A3
MAGKFDYFVVLAEMRTGSNFLEANLNEFDGLQCYGEAFNPHFVGHKNKSALCGVTLDQRETDPMSLIAALRAAGDELPGFRFFHDHDPRVLAHVLADRRCAKIILTRNPAESYVSLQIAAQTGQWKLSDMKDRRDGRAVFDPAGFETFLATLQQFQQRVLHSLQTTGQTAFYVAYDDIGDLDVINGMARFLGVDQKLDALSGALKKQNPEPLAEKVENFAEMQAALAGFDRFDLTRTPNFEPRRGPAVPGFIAAATAPLLYMPLKGGPVAEATAWLQAFAPDQPLITGFTQKTLRQWKRKTPGHRGFTIVSHPVLRAYRSFAAHILGAGGDSFPAIRETLAGRYKVPLPKPGTDISDDQRRAAFLGFLGFLKGNLAGQTSIRVDASWATQDAVIQGFAQFAAPDLILREDRLPGDWAMLAAQVDLAAPEAPAGDNAAQDLARIYDAEIEAAARDVYQRDYMVFGYRGWA